MARRLLSSFGATVFGSAVTVLIQLVNVPVMLRTWGPELFGEWLVLSAVPTYLLLSDLGFGNVAGTDMTLRVHAGDRAGAVETFQSTQALVLLTTGCLAVVVVGVFAFVPLHGVLRFSALSTAEARTTLILLSINCLVVLQWSVIMAAYRSTERYASGILSVNVIRVIEGASVFVVLFSRARPPQLAALMLGISVLGTAWLVIQHVRVNPWLAFGLRFARWTRVKELARPALAYMAFPAGNALITQGMTMVVAGVLGPLAVAVFNPMRTLSRVGLQLSNAVTNSVWPELSAAFGQENLELARKLHRSACQAALGLSLVVTVALAFAGPRLFALWTHGRLTMDRPTFFLLLLSGLAYAGWSASSAVPLAANRHRQVAVRFLACTAAAVLLACFLTHRYALRGAAVAALLCDVAMSVYVTRMSNRLLGDAWPAFAASMLDVTALRRMWGRVGRRLAGT